MRLCVLVYCLTQSKHVTNRTLLLLLRVCLERLMKAWKRRKCVRITSPDQEELKSMFTHSATPILSTYSVSCAMLAFKLCDLILMLTTVLICRCGERKRDCPGSYRGKGRRYKRSRRPRKEMSCREDSQPE